MDAVLKGAMLKNPDRKFRVLNLFAYIQEGLHYCACAYAGYNENGNPDMQESYNVSVTHVDASKGDGCMG